VVYTGIGKKKKTVPKKWCTSDKSGKKRPYQGDRKKVLSILQQFKENKKKIKGRTVDEAYLRGGAARGSRRVTWFYADRSQWKNNDVGTTEAGKGGGQNRVVKSRVEGRHKFARGNRVLKPNVHHKDAFLRGVSTTQAGVNER